MCRFCPGGLIALDPVLKHLDAEPSNALSVESDTAQPCPRAQRGSQGACWPFWPQSLTVDFAFQFQTGEVVSGEAINH